ncbi:MAG TPA: carboxypeptidase regulatory-like domain-containing protein, partial [Longimicrobiales bacterium]|nr:carboxypeptidase regulatory-like domain-containing protein [Longimicrobiales bacterium]
MYVVNMRLVITTLLAIVLAGTGLHGQTLRVKVTGANAEPVQGAAISVVRSADQTLLRVLGTDPQGAAIFAGLAAGAYAVRAEMIGFESVEAQVVLSGDTLTNLFLRLIPQPVIIDPVTARGERARSRFEEEAGATVRELTRAELKLIPGLAEADVMRAVEALPGVVSTSDFSSAFNVRGGSADQNLILLDGIPIYNPFHLG